MSRYENKHDNNNEGERKAAPTTATTTATNNNMNVIDLDNGGNDYATFMGGSAAFGRTAFAQSGDQPAAFINFQDSETYRSVQIHNNALDQEGVRSVAGMGHAGSGMHGGSGIGTYDNPFFSVVDTSPFGLDTLSLDGLKPVRMHTGGAPTTSSKQLDGGISQLRPTFTAVEIPASGERGELVEPPQPPGGYLEPAYHFFSRTSPKTILDTIVAVLSSAGVDCALKQDRFRISCAVYSVGQRLPFSVRVFATHGFDRRYAVEFQRRAGDVLLFNEIYRSARCALEASGLVEGGIRTKAAPLVSLDTLPPLPPIDGNEAVDYNRVTCKNLQNMAASKYVDVKCQAITALCDMTNNVTLATTSMMITEGVIDTLVAESRSDFEDVHRPAVTAIANLTFRRKDVAEAVMSADGMKSLLKLASSDTLQVVRECARCLSNIASCVGNRMDTDELRGVVRTLMCSEDVRARGHVHDLLATLHITTV